MFKLSKLLTYALLTQTALCGSAFAAEKIKNIKILGNQRVESSTVRNFLKFNVGDEFSNVKQDEAIRSLYSSALFKNIKLDFNQGELKVVITENPIINHITIDGNSKINGSQLRKIITSKPGKSFSSASFNKDVMQIKAVYKNQGRFIVKVEPIIKELENNRVDITYKITEGPKTKIRKIVFAGNHNYTDSELKSVISTKESAWFRIFGNYDTYDMNKIEFDEQSLVRFYKSLGYADFQVLSTTAELSGTKDFFDITYSIYEGPKYSFGEVSISSLMSDVDSSKFHKYINISKGEKFSLSKIEAIVDKISSDLADAGYNQVGVYPELQKDEDNLIVNVDIKLHQSVKAYINKINITGNVKTQDKVIRREMRVSEGDAFNRSKIQRSERNIHNLDFFETVDVDVDTSSTPEDDKVDLDIEVKEKSTSSVSFQLSYQHPSKIGGSVNFKEANLFGTGKDLDLTVSRSKQDQSYAIDILEPYFMGRDIGVGVGALYNKSLADEEAPYNSKYYGARIFGMYEINDDWGHHFEYMIKQEKLTASNSSIGKTNKEKNPLKEFSGIRSYFVREQLGKKITSSVANTISYNRLDSMVVPKNGYKASLMQEVAGLGGDVRYVKHVLSGNYYKSFLDNKLTLAFLGELGNVRGIAGQKVTMNNRFKLGDSSMRGFEAGGLGPRDVLTSESVGGNNYYKLTADLSFPIKAPDELALRGSVFVDVGGLWGFDIKDKQKFLGEVPGASIKDRVHNEKTPRVSVGLGFSLKTPMGPVRIDYAFPIRKKKYDKKQNFHLRMTAGL